MKPITAIVVLLGAFVLGGCGESEQDQAKAQVCDARADISTQIDKLRGLTISTATTSQIQDSLKAIRDDLTKIKNARGDLDEERRSQVQEANQAFETEVRSTLSTLGSTTSLSDARTQLTQAFQQLASAYEATFAKIDCS